MRAVEPLDRDGLPATIEIGDRIAVGDQRVLVTPLTESTFAIARRPLPSTFDTQSCIGPEGSVRQYASRPPRESSMGARDTDGVGDASGATTRS